MTTTFGRRIANQIRVGSVLVGGDAPVSVQSMTTTKTADVEATLAQIYALAAAGADLVRCTCNEAAAEGLAQIGPRSPVPIVADIHHQYRRGLEALDAEVACLRLNPGNIRRPAHIKATAAACRDRGVPVRNGGSLDPELYESHGGPTATAMVESASRELGLFEDVGFDDVKISVEASNVRLMIEAYRLLSETTHHPLHLGVTEAGPPPAGLVNATAGMATLLAEGIGDTIRLLIDCGSTRVVAMAGVEDALRRADTGAAAEAEADRVSMLDDKGADDNGVETKIDLIRKLGRTDAE